MQGLHPQTWGDMLELRGVGSQTMRSTIGHADT
jgi:hypothetical protein